MKKRWLVLLLAGSLAMMAACGITPAQPQPSASGQEETEGSKETIASTEQEGNVQTEGEKQTEEAARPEEQPAGQNDVSVDFSKPIKSVAVQDRPLKS